MNRSIDPSLPTGAGSTRAPMLDPARLDELMRLLGRARLDGLLDLLIDDCRERPARIRSCHGRGDLTGLSAEAEALSRAARSIGAACLADAATSLARSGDLAGAVALIEALDEAAHATLCVARQLFGRRFALKAYG